MSQILNVYKEVLESKQRFVDEIFEAEIYKSAVPHLTIIDAGAFEGEFSFYCYNFADRIYAIEPDPRPFGILKDRVDKYVLDKISYFPIALSDKNGEDAFHASGEGGSYISRAISSNGEDKDITVPCFTLEQFMKDNNIKRVNILKVDIESGENLVFKAESFKKVAKKIDIIIGEHLSGVKDVLESYGFEASQVEGNNLLFRRKKR